MAQFNKPSNINDVWASGGDSIYPGDTKYATGWQVEIPPRQYFNFIDNKQDQMLAHINQHGIVVWDSETEYQANKSYVQGSDGTIYRAIQTHTNQDPVADVTNTYWQNPLALPVATEAIAGIAEVATAAEALAGTDDTKIMTPLKAKSLFDSNTMRRIVRLSSAAVQGAAGNTEPTFTPLSHSFTADGGLYLVLVKLNCEVLTSSGTENTATARLKNNGAALDIQSQNLPSNNNNGHNFFLIWSGTLTGAVSLTVTFATTSIAGNPAIAVNADNHNMTSNDTGQISCLEVYRMGA